MTTVITYGTFDLFHVGHLRLLERAGSLGDRLYVGISTDDFNGLKGKHSLIPFGQRMEIVAGLGCVAEVFPETCWEQKESDIHHFRVDILVMGVDWEYKFDFLKPLCSVVYLPRTEGISSTQIRQVINRGEDSSHNLNLEDDCSNHRGGP